MTNATLLLIITGFVTLLLGLLVTALALHKRSANRQLNVMGARGIIETDLNPEGAVIIDGELWRARLKDGSSQETTGPVRVVGVQGHLLLVEPEFS